MLQHKTSIPSERMPPNRWLWAIVSLVVGTAAHAISLQTILEDAALAGNLMSTGLWQQVVLSLGGTILVAGEGTTARVEIERLLLVELGFSSVAWFVGGWCLAHWRRTPLPATICDWGRYGWLWWFVPGVWELLRLVALSFGFTSLATFLFATPAMWQAVMLAGWVTTGCWLAGSQKSEVRGQRSAVRSQKSDSSSTIHDPQSTTHDSPLTTHHSSLAAPLPRAVWIATAAYFITFAAMNIGLWNSLLVPHGDSAMYEEHLWNVLHGKGFRSYLDNGRLFLGEHVQVIHLLLIPLYALWPSHVLLELCQSLALAAGAIPVFRLAERHTGSRRAGILLAFAYLFYFPMQFLDIAIDLKTFRPNSFEIPFLLFALDALERGRTRSLLGWLFLTLLCQEDAAPVIAPLGVWIALRGRNCRLPIADCRLQTPVAVVPFNLKSEIANRKSSLCLGTALALFGVVYTVLVIKVVLPHFRGGDDVHFAQYFSDLGGSTGEIVRSAFTRPGLFLGKFFNIESAVFALALLMPVGFVSLLSPGRLAVGAPLFAVLCLNQISKMPVHHFHAALVPIVFWSAAAGLGNVPRAWGALRDRCGRRSRIDEGASTDETRRRIPATAIRALDRSLPVVRGEGLGARDEEYDNRGVEAVSSHSTCPSPLAPRPSILVATWSLSCSLAMGLFLTLTPFGIAFWDPQSTAHWQRLYVPGPRARQFPRILALIPKESRVASTDFIHPRFTHHSRSYDYSGYRPIVPDDTDYIVIDTLHPYSKVNRVDEIREFRSQPSQWVPLEDGTSGGFIVLRRSRR
jgi:uncharacterized membrane protein